MVKNSITDGQVSDWVKANVNKTDADKEALSTRLLSYGTEGPLLERLIQRKAESGLQDRDDIPRMFQCTDADEGRGRPRREGSQGMGRRDRRAGA